MKVILHADAADDLVFACRAAMWLLAQPDTQKDAILVYGRSEIDEKNFYVRRNRSSTTARQFARRLRQ